jgi:hypothetical protein
MDRELLEDAPSFEEDESSQSADRQEAMKIYKYYG